MDTNSESITDRYYSASTLASLLDVSRATIWRWSANGDAPPLRRIGPGTTRGRASEWDEFMADAEGWRARHRTSHDVPEAA
jgi:predicted DNA-binding transcriptional regulator AlpA